MSWLIGIVTIVLIISWVNLTPDSVFLCIGMFDQIYLSIISTVNNYSQPFIVLVSLISWMVLIWSSSYMSSKFNLSVFIWFLLLFVVSMQILLISSGVLLIFIGWEGLGLSSFILIAFYQNWISINGSVLTLLTNRMGDGLLLLCAGYWVMTQNWSNQSMSIIPTMLLLLLAITNSAQWPFISWLPAAIAAPTPISALVHSSTLVTAGIWLTLNINQDNSWVSTLGLWLGVLTLTVAGLSALFERDLNNVVALSTLSQLGIIFIAISLGNITMCLFHVFSHALANASLFISVGNIIHISYSQQDTRSLASLNITSFSRIGLSISAFSLIGLIFFSGFFSNEVILSNISSIASLVVILILVSISSLTLAYLLNMIIYISSSKVTSQVVKNEWASSIPVMLLNSLVIMFGFVSTSFVPISTINLYSSESGFWLLLSLVALLITSVSLISISSLMFLNQMLLVTKPNSLFNSISSYSEASFWETLILNTSLNLNNLTLLSSSVILITSVLILFILII